MSVTQADVVARAPELATLSASAFTQAIADAEAQTNSDFFGSLADLAVCYLAAHFLAVQNPSVASAAGPVSSEKVGELARSYAVAAPSSGTCPAEYASTRWGLMYWALLRKKARPMVV